MSKRGAHEAPAGESRHAPRPRPVPLERGRGLLLGAFLLGVAWLSRWLLDPALGGNLPFVTFFIAVALAAWLTTHWTASVVLVIGWVLADYHFVDPRGILFGASNDPAYVVGLLAYFAVSGVVLMVAQSMRHAQRKLEGYGGLMQTTLSSIGDAVITTDTQARVTTMNPTAERMTGWLIGDARGRPLQDVFCIVNEETRGAVESPVTKALRLGSIVGLANHTILISKDRTERPIDDSAAPIRNSEGTMIGVVMVFHDITERRQGERELQRSEARKAAILESALDGIVSMDQSGNVMDCNSAAATMFGYTRDEFIGRPIADLIVPQRLRQPHRDGLERYLSTGVAQILGRRIELPALRSDGSELQCELSVTRARTPGEPFFTAHLRDLTEHQRLTKRLRFAEDRWILAMESAELGAWSVDPNTYDMVSDDRFRILVHGSSAPITYEESVAAIHPDDRSRIIDSVAAALDEANPKPYVEEYRVIHPDGSLHWVVVRGRANFDTEGATRILSSFDGTILDVTKRRRVEEMHLAEREAHLARERVLRTKAEEANRSKDMFLANLSHEMRTPLNSIVGWMHLLRRKDRTDAELLEGLDVIERSTHAQVQLIEDVLDVSRIVSGKFRLDITPCDLIQIVEAGIEPVRPAAAARDIRLEMQLDAEARRAVCDGVRIQQVVWNLVANAVKFTPKGGRVSVELEREMSSNLIRVSDNGQGIAEEVLPHIFDRFRQADSSTTRRFSGLGLGLSIVKHLVEAHGGTVDVQSPGEGLGATFTVWLPVAAVFLDEETHRLTEGGSKARSEDLMSVRLDGVRILAVDDEPDARRVIVKVLEAAGAMVTAVSSAAEALEALATDCRPDVLVSDIGMPDQDGFELIRRVRTSGRSARDLPAVALTAFAHQDYARKALLAGFQVHVPKPVDPDVLTTAIGDLIGIAGS